jgi:recombination protein RecA
MAKKDKEVVQVPVEEEVDSLKLSKLLIKEMNKDAAKTGKLAWCLATDVDNPTEVKEWISTGSTLLNFCISNKPDGGIPVGKLTEISGEEASGKTLLVSHLAADVQRRGGIVIYIDTENAINAAFMQQLGVNINELVYCQPGTIEEVGETIEKVILMSRARAKNKLVLVIWDSVAGTPSAAEIEGNYDPNDRIGVTAKALAKMMRKLTQVWGKDRIAMVFTNQLKVKIGVMYGDPMSTPGGKAIPYHASVRVRLTRSTEVKDVKTNNVCAINTRAKVVKNRLGPPLRKCDFQISFARGIEDVKSWFDYLHEAGEIEKAAGWCYLTSFPSFELDVDGKDRGYRFRESQWENEVRDSPPLFEEKDGKKIVKRVSFEDHVRKLLEKNLVIKYGETPKDQEIDPESLMDNECVIEQVLESKSDGG